MTEPQQSETPAPRRKRVDLGFALVIAIAVGAGGAVWALRGGGRVAEILLENGALLLSIAPKIVAAVFLAAWMRLLISKEAVARWFGRDSGIRGVLRATAAGVILPGGPMTAYPIAAAFGRAGADAGAAAAFIASWLLLGANRTIVWEMAFIEHATVGWRVLLCSPFPILLALIARSIGRPRV